jgi:hypothetical protein
MSVFMRHFKKSGESISLIETQMSKRSVATNV